MERNESTRSRPRHAPGRWRLAALSAVAAVALTGCLDGEIAVTVNADGSGTITIEAFPSPQAFAALDDVDIEAALAGSVADADGFEYSEINKDGLDGYRVEVPFEDYRAIVPILIEGGSVLGQRVVLFSSFSLTELPDDGWQLTADINPIAEVVRPGIGGPTAALDQLADALERSSPKTGFELSISLPGEVLSSNADRTSGGTATWVLDRVDAPPQLRMRTEPTSFPTPLHLVLGGAALVLLLGVVLALIGARRPYQRTEGDRLRRRAARRRGARGKGRSSAWAPPSGSASTGPAGHPASSGDSRSLPPLAAVSSEAASTVAAPAPAPAVAAPAPGWYDDPEGSSRARWWDGQRWTDQFSDAD